MKNVPEHINPIEFFGFLAQYRDYPTSGYQLSRAARERGYSAGLVDFFEAMPGTFENEADILPFAEEQTMPPTGSALELEEPQGFEQLTIQDVQGNPED